jgi:hypothetical protein
VFKDKIMRESIITIESNVRDSLIIFGSSKRKGANTFFPPYYAFLDISPLFPLFFFVPREMMRNQQ